MSDSTKGIMRVSEVLRPGGLVECGLAERWRSVRRPWDAARELVVERHNDPVNGTVIDPGVNFFVLMLEHLGARPQFSCEGHPDGFYVSFEADYDLALRIAGAGYFRVEIEGGINRGINRRDYWSIRKDSFSEADRKETLRWAAESWVVAFLQES